MRGNKRSRGQTGLRRDLNDYFLRGKARLPLSNNTRCWKGSSRVEKEGGATASLLLALDIFV